MSKEKKNPYEFQEEFNLRESLDIYLLRWKWFVLAIMITCSIAYLMLRYSQVIYESKARVLIKIEKAGAYSELSAFQDLGLFEGLSGYNNLFNEKEIFQSRPLIEKVIRSLELNKQYSLIGTKTGLIRHEFYKNSPVELIIDPGTEITSAFNYNIEILDKDKYKFIDSDKFRNKVYSFGDTLENNNGKFVIRKSKLYSKRNDGMRIGISVVPIGSAVIRYQNSLSIDQVNENVDVLELTMRGPVVKKNNDFLDSLITQHTRMTIQDQLLIYKNTTSFINDRIDAISDELTEVEKDGEEYKTEYDFSDILMSERSLYDRTLVNEKKLVDAEVQLELMRFMVEYIDNHKGNDDLLPANLGIENAAINDEVTSYNKLVLEKLEILPNVSKINPELIRMENELVKIKASLRASIENARETLIMEVKRFQSLEGELNSDISNLPKHKRVLRSIERQQQVKESLYLYLLQKREENEIASAVTEGNSKTIEMAYSSGKIVSPNRKMYYAAALFIGLIIPFSMIYLLSLLDNKVRTKDDLEKYKLSLLSSIPKISGDEKIVIKAGDTSPSAEAFRILRTNTNFILNKRDGSGQVIIITSTIAQEGKSFIALNLATSFALTGKRTVVVGLDLRAPKLSKYADLANSKGVSEFLTDGSIDLDKIIVTSDKTENLYFLPAGVRPPNPAELLLRDELKEMVDQLKSKFDVIIIDTAPIGLVTDTLLVSDLSDAILYVVRANYLEKKMLAIPSDLLANKKIKNVGFIINALQKSSSKGRYGYGYGYGYGYSEEKNANRKWYQFWIKRS